MEVVRQDDESVNPPGVALHGPRQSSEQPLRVVIIAHDVLPAVAAGDEVVDRVGILDTQSAWHANSRHIPADPKQENNLKPGLSQTPLTHTPSSNYFRSDPNSFLYFQRMVSGKNR
jgi:hypothetical protein